jgi:hypothetical protein
VPIIKDMGDSRGTRLSGQQPLTASGAGGGAAVFFGVVFTAAGAFVTAIGLGWIPVDPSSVHAPMAVIAACGAIFGVPGLLILVTGIRGAVASRRRRIELALRPDEPWLADREWNERGESFTGTARFLKSAVATLFLAVFLVPFNWWAWFSPQEGVMVKIFVSVFDLALVFAVGEALRRFLAMLRYGRSEVLYDSFPFFVGEEMSLSFRRPGHAVFSKLTFRLQCIEERMETTGRGKNRTTRRIPFALWQRVVERNEEDGAAAAYGDDKLEFTLPADRPGNRFGESPPTYWQLLVTGEAVGPDYEGQFLLPVYERPTAVR